MAKWLNKSFSFWEPDVDRTDSEVLAKSSRKKKDSPAKILIGRKVKHLTYHRQIITSIEQIISIPSANECYEIGTLKSMNAFSLLLLILKHRPFIHHLYITTFNMNELTLLSLLDLFDSGVIQNISFCVSESVKFRMPKRYIQIKLAFDQRKNTNRFRVALTWNHSKICLVDCGNDKLVIRGSGNFSDNAEIEEYTIANNAESYDFYKNELIEKHIFINSKQLKRHEVWETQKT